MAKKKTVYSCNECGYESSGWLGKCPECGSWNSFTETIIQKKSSSLNNRSWLNDSESKTSQSILNLSQVSKNNQKRLSSKIDEMDRVLGGGFVQGSLVLLGGDPGIGKS
ncbi:MAG TPA: DNA repair protein RadA, partial [Candidatus Eisenbacteria bacterium]|nr:DNA repair protein RadA [Candidatus Eisenbacteria bacterium]